MNMNEYQEAALETFHQEHGEDGKTVVARLALGVCGEAGEVAEAVKKYLRGDFGWTEVGERLEKEMGDTLWYIAVLADSMGLPLQVIADNNLKKLASRKERGVIKGSGDDR